MKKSGVPLDEILKVAGWTKAQLSRNSMTNLSSVRMPPIAFSSTIRRRLIVPKEPMGMNRDCVLSGPHTLKLFHQ